MASRRGRCVKWQRVKGQLRCLTFRQRRRRPGMGFRRGHRPANLGKRCKRFKLVFSPRLNHKVYRCASYGPGRPRRQRRPMLPMLPPPRKRLPPPPAPSRARSVPKRLVHIPLSLPSYERISHVPSTPVPRRFTKKGQGLLF